MKYILAIVLAIFWGGILALLIHAMVLLPYSWNLLTQPKNVIIVNRTIEVCNPSTRGLIIEYSEDPEWTKQKALNI